MTCQAKSAPARKRRAKGLKRQRRTGKRLKRQMACLGKSRGKKQLRKPRKPSKEKLLNKGRKKKPCLPCLQRLRPRLKNRKNPLPSKRKNKFRRKRPRLWGRARRNQGSAWKFQNRLARKLRIPRQKQRMSQKRKRRQAHHPPFLASQNRPEKSNPPAKPGKPPGKNPNPKQRRRCCPKQRGQRQMASQQRQFPCRKKINIRMICRLRGHGSRKPGLKLGLYLGKLKPHAKE